MVLASEIENNRLLMKLQDLTIAVIGLGYVGLPLAIAFNRKRKVYGFDIDPERISSLDRNEDNTLEVSKEDLQNADNLVFTSNLDDLKSANFFIITVPTPIDNNNQPDLRPLLAASKSVGSILKRGDIVVLNQLFILVPQRKNVFQC